jgi:hypothetical protein
MQKTRQANVWQATVTTNITIGTTHHKVLVYQNVLVIWVPKKTNAQQKAVQMGLSLSHLQCYQKKDQKGKWRVLSSGNITLCSPLQAN